MPTYRFRRPRETERRTVVADSYERDGDNVVFVGVTDFDGQSRQPPHRVAEKVSDEIETLD